MTSYLFFTLSYIHRLILRNRIISVFKISNANTINNSHYILLGEIFFCGFPFILQLIMFLDKEQSPLITNFGVPPICCEVTSHSCDIELNSDTELSCLWFEQLVNAVLNPSTV